MYRTTGFTRSTHSAVALRGMLAAATLAAFDRHDTSQPRLVAIGGDITFQKLAKAGLNVVGAQTVTANADAPLSKQTVTVTDKMPAITPSPSAK